MSVCCLSDYLPLLPAFTGSSTAAMTVEISLLFSPIYLYSEIDWKAMIAF